MAGARGLLEQAIASGHFEVAPRATLTLGSLLASQEDPEQVGFFEQAAASRSLMSNWVEGGEG